jgi:hypothetical protein
MAELICMSPGYVVSRSKDGPPAEQLYQLTRANLARRGRGALTVKVTRPDVQIYVDERITRPGAPVADLIPCLHRIVVLDSLDRARQYEAMVVKDQHVVLELDWEADPAVHATAGWVELRFQTETERARRAELARRLVRSATKADAFVLIDVIVEDRERHVIASLRAVRRDQILREASFVATGDDAASMRALARFVGGGPAHASIRVRVLPDLSPRRAPARAGAPAAAPAGSGASIHKYALSASALIGIGGGAALIYVATEQRCNAQSCRGFLLSLAAGTVMLAGGAALGGLAVHHWTAAPPPRRRVGLQLDPGRRGGVLVATWPLR